MDEVFGGFKAAIREENGYRVAETLSPVPPPHDPGRLYTFYRSSNANSIDVDVKYAIVYNSDLRLKKAEGLAWQAVFVAYWKAVEAILAAEEATNQGRLREANWTRVYDTWKAVVNALIHGHGSGEPALAPWTLPCLYITGKYLRLFAIKADEYPTDASGSLGFGNSLQEDGEGLLDSNAKLEDAARVLNRAYSLCLGDRNPIEDSRKWGVYYVANLMFKTHFRLNSTSLSKSVIRTIGAQADMPPFTAFPKSHQVTFNYYAGVIFFLDEDYAKAEEYLTAAWRLCHRGAKKNIQLILSYLIPCHLLTTHTLPTQQLLAPHPDLQRLFAPLAICIKRGDLAGFDAALAAGEAEFVRRRIYLTLERGRDIALRNLLRRVYLAGGFEPLKEGQTERDLIRRTRIPVSEFAAGIRLSMGRSGDTLEMDEVECMLANMIYKNLMKGYIARERGIVVLSKGGAFPGTGV